MSHFTVAVFLPNDKNIEDSVDRLLAPYYADSEYCNHNAKWDWYMIGGRWQGKLILKNKKKGIRGEPGCMEKMTEYYDGAFVCDIDFGAMCKRELDSMHPYEERMKNHPFMKETNY